MREATKGGGVNHDVVSAMPMLPDPSGQESARLLQEHLDWWLLERALLGNPEGPEARPVLERLADGFLEDLARMHCVDGWTPPAFRKAFLEGALAHWKPGTKLVFQGRRLRVLSPVCPLGNLTEVDPDACEGCRGFQAAAARRALGDRVVVSLEERISRGDGVCSLTYTIKE